MSADKKKIAGECWKRGNDALGKYNWDYAIDMYRQAVRLVPDNQVYRQTLRGAAEKKYGNNGTGARMAGAKLMGVRGKIKKARLTKNWEAVDSLAEDGLAINPWDGQLNADLGDACAARADAMLDAGNEEAALGFRNVAIEAYKRALKATPDSKPLNRALGTQYEAKRDYKAAIGCWEKVRRIDPHDAEARSKCSQLAASSTIDHAHFEDAKSTQDVMADHEVARRIGTDPNAAAGPGVSREADLQRAIRKEPDNKDNYLKLADFYERAGKMSDAEEQLTKALELSGGDANIREKLEDIQIKRDEKYVLEAKEIAKKQPTKENVYRARQLMTNLVKQQIKVLTVREERYPSDMRLKLELATLLMRFKEWKQAIPRLQKAVTDTRIRGEALVRLGMCFLQDHKAQLARHQLEQALNEVDHESNPTMYKEMLYMLGTICEAAKDVEAAIKYYSMVLAVDYGYKDAVTRLERLQGSEGQ